MSAKLRKKLGISQLATAIVDRQLADLKGTDFESDEKLKQLRFYRIDLERSAQTVLDNVANFFKPPTE